MNTSQQTRTPAAEAAQSAAEATAAPKRRRSLWTLPVVRLIAPPGAVDEAIATPDAAGDPATPPWELPGAQLRTHARRARSGWYQPRVKGAPTSTRQAEILNPAVIGAPTGHDGIAIGRDVLSRTLIAHDPITAYNAVPRRVTSPNTIRLGDVGSGKTNGSGCNDVLRALALRKRRVFLVDKKDQQGAGEHTAMARRLGVEPLRFAADGSGTRLNLLDPAIVQAGKRAHSTKSVVDLLGAVAATARNNQPLTAQERSALRVAVDQTFSGWDERSDRHRVLSDVLPHLGEIPKGEPFDRLSQGEREAFHAAGIGLMWTLTDLINTYGGMIDGDTSSTVGLDHRLTVWDISQLPDAGPAVPVVMAIGHMWLLGRLRQADGWRTNVIWEEGWHLLGGPSAALIKSSEKLSRGRGISNIFNMHKGSDIPEGSDGMSVLQESQTVCIYRLDRPEEADWCVRTFGLAPETARTITNLDVGHYILKLPGRPETRVEHIRSDFEIDVMNTDGALAG